MIIAPFSKLRDGQVILLRQRLEAVTSFLAWPITTLSANALPERDGCRVIMKREPWGRREETTFVIDITAGDDVRPGSYPVFPGNVVHASVSEDQLTEQFAANLRLTRSANCSIDYPLSRQILTFELPAGHRMTKAVLEARLVRLGFDPAKVSAAIMSMLGDWSLHADLREPITGGSLVWRRRKDQKANHDALPWDQILTYCSPV